MTLRVAAPRRVYAHRVHAYMHTPCVRACVPTNEHALRALRALRVSRCTCCASCGTSTSCDSATSSRWPTPSTLSWSDPPPHTHIYICVCVCVSECVAGYYPMACMHVHHAMSTPPRHPTSRSMPDHPITCTCVHMDPPDSPQSSPVLPDPTESY